MKITKIAGEKYLTARSLWEEVFSEDSKEFTDYYFTYKASDNIGYVLGEEHYEAMMFRTPYEMQLWEKRRQLSYIVGVATRPEYRHRGYMRALLMTAFGEMYREKQIFTFLMPANPAIYEPFDFRYVYERPVWQFADERFPLDILETIMETGGEYSYQISGSRENILKAAEKMNAGKAASITLKSLGKLCENDSHNKAFYGELAAFADGQLAGKHDIYVHRDAAYYQRQLIELKAQNGDIFIAFNEENKIQGFFLYTREEDEIFIQELIEREPGTFPFIIEEAEKKPIIMARIIHAEEMMRLARSKEPKNPLIEIEDNLIPENDGLYRWELTPFGSTVTKLKDYRTPDLRMDIGELTVKLVTNLFINEIV